MNDIGISACIGTVKAVAKHCYDLCASAKQHQQDAARIRLRIAYALSQISEWSNHISSRQSDDKEEDDPCSRLRTSIELK